MKRQFTLLNGQSAIVEGKLSFSAPVSHNGIDGVELIVEGEGAIELQQATVSDAHDVHTIDD